MGALANAIMEYAQPLIDATDGTIEQLNKALAVSQACWNIALLPKEERQSAMQSLVEGLSLDDAESEELQRSLLLPMIARHEEMFPMYHLRESVDSPHWAPSLSPLPSAKSPEGKSSMPGRYDPCPCNSGRKFKFCCERAARRL